MHKSISGLMKRDLISICTENKMKVIGKNTSYLIKRQGEVFEGRNDTTDLKSK